MTTATLTLANFLLARIGEDEARDGRWRVRPSGPITCPCGQSGYIEGEQDGYDRPNLGITHVVGWNPPAVVAGEVFGHGSSSTVTHVLVSDDAAEFKATFPLVDESHRVLAECDAKRRIINEHSDEWDHGDGRITHTGACETCREDTARSCDDQFPCATLRILALPYADHPDYRDEWRP